MLATPVALEKELDYSRELFLQRDWRKSSTTRASSKLSCHVSRSGSLTDQRYRRRLPRGQLCRSLGRTQGSSTTATKTHGAGGRCETRSGRCSQTSQTLKLMIAYWK